MSDKGKGGVKMDERTKRLEVAKRDFKKLQEEIAPFVRQRKLEPISTEGQWRDASVGGSSLCSDSDN